MAQEKDWQVQTTELLNRLTALPRLSGMPVLSLETEMRQSVQSLGVGAGQERQVLATLENSVGTREGYTQLGTVQRSAYQEAQALRRQSERLLQI